MLAPRLVAPGIEIEHDGIHADLIGDRIEDGTRDRLVYGLKLWPALVRFLDDGRLEIDNNIAERALRCVAVGRRNWLFAGSQVGGERAAAILTVIETCKANGVEPQAYIADVIAKIAADWPAARWDELMPWNWQPAQPQLAQAA